MFENLTTVLQEYGKELVNKYQYNLLYSDRIATGELLNNIEYIIQKDNVSISVCIQIADYFKFIERDTKPHWPPVDAIRNYVKAKPILPRPDKKGKLPTPEQLTYLIGQKISEEGTKGTHNFEKTSETLNAKYEKLIEEAITKDIEKEFNVFFTEFFSS